MAAESTQTLIRMSSELKESLIEAAKHSHRSLSAEIGERLENSVKTEANLPAAVAEQISRLEDRLIEWGTVVGEDTTEIRLILKASEDRYHYDKQLAMAVPDAIHRLAERIYDVVDEQRKEVSELRRELSELRRELSEVRRQKQAKGN
jgi:polyhydroxyalkanoate synthesis regulator phasin